MVVRVYPDGEFTNGLSLELMPADAARVYCEKSVMQTNRVMDLVVIPNDDEARALPGWQTDGDGPFLLFRVTAEPIVWTAEQVESHNPFHKADE